MVSDEGLNVSCCRIQGTKNYVALCEDNILPNPSMILAEEEARVVSGIREDKIASNLVSNMLIVQCVMYHDVCIFHLNDSKHWSTSIRMTD